MATLQEIEAEIARRRGQQQQIQQVTDLQTAQAQDLQAIQSEIARRQVPRETPGQIARAPGGVLAEAPEEARAVRELPELGTGGLLAGESQAEIAKIIPAVLTTTDPEELGQILTANFPDVGLSRTPEGDLLATNNKTGATVVVNKPGISKLDVMQGLGLVAAFTPAARVAAIPAGVAGRAAVGAVGAGLTETAIQSLQEQLGGELNPEEIAIAGALGGVAEIVIPAIQAIRQARTARQIGAVGEEIEAVGRQIEVGREAAEATGVPLFQAQQTGIPAQLEKQAFVAQLPAGTQRATAQLRAQNEAVSTAVDDFLGLIAPPEAITRGAEKFRTAARNAVERQALIRKERTSPIYRDAFRQGADVDLAPVNSIIEESLEEFPKGGEVVRNLTKIKGLLTRDGAPTLRQLHNAKLEIDQMINKVGETSLGNTTKAEILKIKDQLLTQMDDASDLYRTARETFAAESPAVTRLQESLIGKIADIDDTQLKAVSRRVFDPAETNPQVITQAKKVIQDIDPDAWNELLRVELERRIGGIKATLDPGTAENVPGQMFNALFGNAKQRRVLFNSVDGEAAKNLKYLETVLGRARLGRPGGSQTAAREEIKRELRGGAVSSVRDFFRQPVSTFISTGEDAQFNRRVKAMANALFDPQWKPRVTKLRKLGTDSPAAARAMAQLLQDVEREEE